MKVAFIMSVYKNDNIQYFKEAINSIQNQDYGIKNINIYLGIDGELPTALTNYINKNKKIFYKTITNKKNTGLASTLNKLINLLEEEPYIFRMDSDDICKIDRVSRQTLFMNNNQNIEILGGAIEEIDEKKTVKMIRRYPKTNIEAKFYIAKASIFAHPTVCFRKSFFSKGFKYNRKTGINEDLDLWISALCNNIEISNLDDVILSLRISNDFYKRRSYKKAFGEFKLYMVGITKLFGLNWRMIYPTIRLFTRLMPSFIVKRFYNPKARKFLNK